MSEDRKLPFDVTIMDKEPQKVSNKLSGESCILEPDAVAVYDTIIGAEAMGHYKIVQQGLGWFRKHFPSEYMILLD